jgi:hypothetical protein
MLTGGQAVANTHQRNIGVLCCGYRFGVGPKCGVDEDGAGGGQRHPAADRAEPCSSTSDQPSLDPFKGIRTHQKASRLQPSSLDRMGSD